MNTPDNSAQYTVVARRYRPQTFGDLVGQSHISQALANAIKHARVGHAYLFTGARGVGKTSTARIFAKCLNCVQGPTEAPCNECDICQSISLGEDVDVLEIDGASNRGIDEIRQLRSNAHIRPSRSRHKIYIIDEVHMLTREAFNALLKTLEEPPEHVKFIFCTTDPQKIPITVLSRCQRYDFSPVQTREILQRLQEICQAEQMEAEPAALKLLARRAAGSMRDSQSLLEQLFSFCDQRITVDDVNQLLGTADLGRVADLARSMIQGDSAACLNLIAQASLEGVDAGQLALQTLGYLRDVMAIQVGASSDVLLTAGEENLEDLQAMGGQVGLETLLAILQILDRCVVRMQSSVHSRTLLEVAVVRACHLENLDQLSDLAAQLNVAGTGRASGSRSVAGTGKKKLEPAGLNVPAPSQSSDRNPAAGHTSTPVHDEKVTPAAKVNAATGAATAASHPAQETMAMRSEDAGTPSPTLQTAAEPTEDAAANGDAEQLWKRVLESCDEIVADIAAQYERLRWKGPDLLEVTLRDNYSRDACLRSNRKQALEDVLQQVSGRKIRIDIIADPQAGKPHPKPTMTRSQQIRELHGNAMVKEAMEIFGAEIVDFHRPSEND